MWVQFYSFTFKYPIYLTPFIKKACSFSTGYSYFPCQMLVDHVHVCLGLFLSSRFSSIGLFVFMLAHTVLMTVSTFIVYPEIRKSDISCSFILSQNLFGSSGSFVVPYKFESVFSASIKNIIVILILH